MCKNLQASPNCLPNCRIEHDLVNLAVHLATTCAAQVATYVQVVFVSVFVFLVQVLTSREVVQQSAHHEQLTLVQIEQAHDSMA